MSSSSTIYTTKRRRGRLSSTSTLSSFSSPRSQTPMRLLLAIATAVGVAINAVGMAAASKDDSYYKAGSGNPNVNQKMYWKDAANVLEDIDQFSALYVQFEHCAWTWMNYESYDSDGDGDGGDGNDVDESDVWYIDATPPFGANVAFSLYGSLKGESFRGCSDKTFINSFYTKAGFEDFVYGMQYAGVSAFSSGSYSGYSSACQGYSGIGCDRTNGFAVHTYSTEECNPQYYSGVSSTLSGLNSAMESAQCVQIYNAKDNQYWYGGNFTVSGTPLSTLASSQACFYQNYWSPDGQCPDPYGKLEFYQSNFNKGVSRAQRQDPFQQYSTQMEESRELASIGTVMILAALAVMSVGWYWPTIQRKAPRLAKASENGTAQVVALAKQSSKRLQSKLAAARARRKPKETADNEFAAPNDGLMKQSTNQQQQQQQQGNVSTSGGNGGPTLLTSSPDVPMAQSVSITADDDTSHDNIQVPSPTKKKIFGFGRGRK